VNEKTDNPRVNPSVLFVLFIIAFCNAFSISGQDAPIRFMTFNIRYDNPVDGINSWDNRKDLVLSGIGTTDIMGMQEVLKHQLDYILEELPVYGCLGAGREDGQTKGEYAPIFYRKDRFRVLDQGTFWLSPTPQDTGSVGWDAVLTRICTWGKFLDKTSGLEFYFLNTHFDHMGKIARTESARLVLDFIQNKTNDLPVILTGDFNSTPKDEPYLILTNPKNGLSDACSSGNKTDTCLEGTFNGFGTQKEPERIDMIFFKGRWDLVSYNVLKIKGGDMFISDHWPVVAELKIKN
jgi:endonuclease/exonuclease/phosphatase family metal-dependent hydrolase